MAAKAKKSTRAVRKVASKSKQSVSIDMVKQAVVALGDRNGSTIKSILNYLVKTKKVSPSSRILVILAIGRGVRNGDLARKLPNTFAVGDGKRKSSPAKKSRKRKTKRTKKTVKSSVKRRRRRTQRKRKSIKKRSRKVSKKSRRNRRKGQTKRKARRSQAKAKKIIAKPVAVSTHNSRRPVRKSARGKNYRM